ncbi:Ig-like domain-containing protein [Flavobacterium psychrotolerans]|uniref:Ig-like domain-containing protein n=1 Tax=Flavobacterium psychrotolerans TaxID=2169410 RepID=A0A2U1JMZ2_9FLAO|nr:T9SS type B sorting domain-containing protein [Flavobacterium psychrotolerans]PWA06228.1 hypothetical protein DB895_04840 [Flavobacterium psychrotolerans]
MPFFNILSLFSRKNRLFTLILFCFFATKSGNAQNLIAANNTGFEGTGGFQANGYTDISPGTSGSSSDGNYALTGDSAPMNPFSFKSVTPHSGTKMMVVDANNQIFWQGNPNVQLTGGTTYTFSYWVVNINKNGTSNGAFPNPVIKFEALDQCGCTPVLKSGSATVNNGAWQQVVYEITPTGTGAKWVRIELSVPGASANGNDFAIDDISLTGPPLPLAISASHTNISCPGLTDASISAYGFGGVEAYSYTLTDPLGVTTPPNATGIFTNLSAGSYTVSVKDSNFPIGNKSTVILIDPVLDMTIAASTAASPALVPATSTQPINTTICSGIPITLKANNMSGYTWTATPADPTLTTPNATSVTVTPTVNTVYKVTANAPSGALTNLIYNGDFEKDTAGFSSSYAYYATNAGFAKRAYGVISNPNTWGSVYDSATDHTNPGTGKMFVTDGSTFLGDKVWGQNLAVKVGISYEFKYYIRSITTGKGNPARMQLKINGVIVNNSSGSTTDTAPLNTADSWLEYKHTWLATSTIATVELYDLEINGAGNDFGLDDITFIPLGVSTCTPIKEITVNISSGTSDTAFSYPTPVCQSAITFTPTKTNPATFTPGGTWSKTVGAGTLSIDSNTGVINPSLSTAGTYTIKYEVFAAACQSAGSSTTSITIDPIPTIATTTPNNRCGTGTVTLGATASAGTINWYAAATGGVSLGTGTSFVTPSIAVNTTYYVDATALGCTTSARTAVLATVNTIPTITGTTPSNRCGTGTVTLGATVSAGTINWYAASIGGASLGTGTSFVTPSIATTTTYYVDATVGTCTTAARTAIIATINPILTPSFTACGATTTSVQFTWLAVTGATGYDVSYKVNALPAVNVGAIGNVLTYAVTPLAAGDNVEITVTPTGGAGTCFVFNKQICTASSCVPPTITATTPNSRCGTGTVTLGAVASAGTINWYVAATGGVSLGTGTSFVTPSISSNTTYYVDATAGCTTTVRTAILATVNTIPTITGTTPNNRCGTGTVTLGATASAGTINWYAASIGGVSLGTGTSFVTPSISSNTTYYVDATVGTCITAARTAVLATINTIPTITGTTPDNRCGTGTVTLGATASAGTINWYAAAAGGVSLGTGTSFVTPSISSNTTYYVDATVGTCITAARTAVLATINTIPTITGTTPDNRCGTGTVTLGATASAGTINWYAVATGGVSLGTGTSFVTPSISSNTTYYVDATVGTCITAARTAILATVNTIPTITGTTPNNRCGTGTVTLGATASAGTINWYAAASGGVSLGTGSSFNTQSISSNATYYVDATVGTCTTAARTAILATVNNTPLLTIGCDALAVTATSVTFTWNAIAGATSYDYNYVTAAGVPVSGSVVAGPTPTLTVNGLTPGENVAISVIPVGSSCPVWVFGNCASQNCPSPTVDAIANITVCANQTVTVPSFTSTPAGATFKWVSNNAAIGIALSGSGDILSFIAKNATTTVQKATISVAATDAAIGCTGPTSTFNITVNPLPTASISGTKSICSGTGTNIVFNGTPSSTVTYTINAGANQTIVLDALGNATLATGNLATDTVYSLVSVLNPATNCAQNQAGTATISINQLPTVVISGTITICSGSGANIDFVGTPNATVTYKINAGANQMIVLDASGKAQLATGNLTAVTSYSLVSVLDSATTCSQVQAGTVTIGINPLPTVIISGTTTICSGTGANIIFSGTPDAVVRYTKDGNPLLLTIKLDGLGKATLATGNLIATTVYDLVSVSDANLCSQTQTGTVTITVNSIPTATISGTTSICSGTGTNITFNGTPNAKVTYTINAGANKTIVLDASGSAILPTGNLVADAIYNLVSVIDSSLACSQTLVGKATITINPLPTATILGTMAICSGTGTNITFTGTSNATVTYKINAGTNQTIVLDATGNATLATGNLIATAVYSLVSVRDLITTCSQAQAGNATITINPLPTVTISGTTSICSGSGTTIVFTGTPNSTVTYTINAGLYQTLQLDGVGKAILPTGNLIATTVYDLVSLTNNTTLCYQTQIGSATVSINPSPVVTATPASQVLCSGEQTGILLTSTLANTTFSWTVLSQIGATGATANSGSDISQVLTATGTALGKVTYSVASIANGCFGSPITVSIDVTPSPKATATPNAKSICSGETTAIALSSSTVGTTFDWNVVQVNVTGAVAGTGSTIAQTLKTVINKPGEVVYIITPILNGCPGLPISVVIKVNPIPDVTANPAQETICSGNATSIALTSNVVATTFVWSVTQTGVIGANSGNGNIIAQTLSTSGIIPGTVDYTITPAVNGCSGIPITVTITVKPTPEVFGSAGTTICSGESPKVNLSPNIVGTVFNWTINPTGVIGASDGTGDTIDQNLVAGTTLGTVIYTVTPTLNGCTGKSINIAIKVNPSPDLAIENGVVCIETTGVVKNAYTLTTNLSVATYDFEWYLNGVLIDGAVKNSYEAQSAGDYSVIITHKITGCISQAAHATVTETNPVNSLVATVTDAFTQNATITVTMPTATNTFLYKMDDGAFQDSNIFTGVSSGVHTITVVDTDGCTDLTQDLRVIDYPKYFTPNGDGFNDTWNIEGLNDQLDANIYIYDRYGKLVKEITTAGQGWDGTHNGQALPATDYWFTVNYLETNVNKLFKSHFSLKR